MLKKFESDMLKASRESKARVAGNVLMIQGGIARNRGPRVVRASRCPNLRLKERRNPMMARVSIATNQGI